MKNLFKKNPGYDPFKEENSRIYFVEEPDFNLDASWLRKKLKNSGGNIYFSSGEANYHVYTQIEDEFRIAHDENNAKIYFLTGPLISISKNSGIEKRQEEREKLNPITRLASEGKLLLFPSYERLPYHYRVFENQSITNVFEPHHLGIRSTGAWYFYYSKIEAHAWKKLFLEALKGKEPVKEPFLDHFLFITNDETAEMKKWAAKNKIDIDQINLKACREFWKEYLS